MMNRTALGLAIGAGYVLGRTKKMKMAFAVGTLVAGKKMQLSPRAVADLVSQQLKSNPQFKEIGDQLRQDLRGVGKAASGALVERQISTLADRLHSRTGQLRDQASGVLPGTADDADDAGDGDEGDEGVEEDEDRGREEQESAEDRSKDRSGDEDRSEDRDEAPRRRPAKKAPARKAAKKAPAKRTGEGDGAAGGAGGAAKKTARTAKKAPARKTAAARGTARRATGGQSGEGRR
ncbi:DNA primase [Streptomyces griseoaurantiacus]|uniref:DNA primase n=1 Tax=Streptomyces griseoaurantiacus TaxID=68213 RepID=UPI00352BF64D